MSRTARLWRGAGFLMLGSLLLSGVTAFADDDPPLSQQLTDLGRQALAQGAATTAETFFQRALKLDPNNKLAAQGLEQSKQRQNAVVRVGMQDPADAQTPPATPAAPAPGLPGVADPGQVPADDPGPRPTSRCRRVPETRATIEQTQAAELLARQQLTNDVEQRLQTRQRAAAIRISPRPPSTPLRLAQNLVRSATNVAEADRAGLDRRIQAQMISTVQAEERIVGERAERQRLEAAAEQRHPRHRHLPAQQGDHRRDDGPVRHAHERGRLQRPVHRRPGRHPRGHPALLRGQAAGPEGLRPPARRAAALQRQRPRSRGRRVRLQRHELLHPGGACSSGSSSIGTCSRCRT